MLLPGCLRNRLHGTLRDGHEIAGKQRTKKGEKAPLSSLDDVYRVALGVGSPCSLDA